jgi:hypothetical protein
MHVIHSYRFVKNIKTNNLSTLFYRFRKETLRVLCLLSLVFAATLPSNFFAPPPAFSQTYDSVPQVPPGAVGSRDPKFHEPVSQGIQLVFNGRIEESLVIFNNLLTENPHHPAPHFLKPQPTRSG